MRIEGYIEHPSMKITIFRMDNHYTVKFATTLYEQAYKLRMSEHIQGIADVRKWVNDVFMERVLLHFNTMHEMALQRHQATQPPLEDDFEVII